MPSWSSRQWCATNQPCRRNDRQREFSHLSCHLIVPGQITTGQNNRKNKPGRANPVSDLPKIPAPPPRAKLPSPQVLEIYHHSSNSFPPKLLACSGQKDGGPPIPPRSSCWRMGSPHSMSIPRSLVGHRTPLGTPVAPPPPLSQCQALAASCQPTAPHPSPPRW